MTLPVSGVLTLAHLVGLQVDWEDANGEKKRVPDSVLETILTHLGVPCANEEEIKQSLVMLQGETPEQKLPPLVTGVVGSRVRLCSAKSASVPNPVVHVGMDYVITLESGTVVRGTLSDAPSDNVADHPADGDNAADIETPRSFVTLNPISEAGYHTLRIANEEITLAIAPPRCFGIPDALHYLQHAGRGEKTNAQNTTARIEEKIWGITAQVYGLRRENDAGVGDFTSLASLVRDAAQMGASSVAISPMHAMFSANPESFSPYSPSSRLFLNVLHVDPAAFFGNAAWEAAISTLALGPTLRELENAPLIDWPGVASARLTLLRHLFDKTRGEHPEKFQDLAHFREAGGAPLENHARFEALQADLVARPHTEGVNPFNWREWPKALQDPNSAEVAAFAESHRDDVDFHIFLQWLANQGLAHVQKTARDAGMPVGVIADLAVGCDGSGSQTWSDPSSMLQGVSVGAPPDLFNQAGQAWGLTTFSPRALVNQGFKPFLDMVRGAFAHAGGIRVDHILGLARLWVVPNGESARDGAYLRYPLDDLLHLLALESWRYHAVVIGEDLGTVPPGLREKLAASGLMGMRVLWFERTAETEKSDIAAITDLSDLGHLSELTDIGSLISLSDEDNSGDDADADAEANADIQASAPSDATLDSTSDDAPVTADSASTDAFVAPANWSRDAIAMTTTHDLPTIAGWWAGHDIVWRNRIGQSSGGDEALAKAQSDRIQEREALWKAIVLAGIAKPGKAAPKTPPINEVLRFVAMSAAPLALFPLEDLLGLEDQPNLPGSINEHPNWRRRLSSDVNKLFGIQTVSNTLRARFDSIRLARNGK